MKCMTVALGVLLTCAAFADSDSAIAQELLHLEHDPAVRRVLERAQYLTDQPLAGE